MARIMPVGVLTTLEQLIADRRISPTARRKVHRPAPVQASGTVSDLVDDQRR